MREEFTDEAEQRRFEAWLRESLHKPLPRPRPHLSIVKDSAPPPPLKVPYPTPWWDRPVFALFLIAMLAGLAAAVAVMVR